MTSADPASGNRNRASAKGASTGIGVCAEEDDVTTIEIVTFPSLPEPNEEDRTRTTCLRYEIVTSVKTQAASGNAN